MVSNRVFDAFKAGAALVMAFALTLAIGSFIGYPVDPDGLAETFQRIDDFEQGRSTIPSDESSQFYAQLRADNMARDQAPHPVVAILKWHSSLFGVLLALLLLVMRPTPAFAVVAGLTGSGVFLLVAGPSQSFMPIAALAGFLAARSLFVRRPVSSNARA